MRLTKYILIILLFVSCVSGSVQKDSNMLRLPKEKLNISEVDTEIKKTKEYIKLNPKDEKLHYNLGICYIEKEEYKNAEASFAKAIELKPDFADAYCNLGNVYLETEKPEKAIEQYKKALSLDPKHTRSYVGAGVSYYNLKKYKEAEESLNKAIELNPSFSFSHYLLGLVYKEMKKKDEAIKEFNKVIEIDGHQGEMVDKTLIELEKLGYKILRIKNK